MPVCSAKCANLSLQTLVQLAGPYIHMGTEFSPVLLDHHMQRKVDVVVANVIENVP